MIELLSDRSNPNPGKITGRLQKVALNTFSNNFLHPEISCCYFHQMQSSNLKINEVGLKFWCGTFSKVNLALRMFSALAHVNPAHEKASFKMGFEEIRDVIEREQVEEKVLEKVDKLAKVLTSKTVMQLRSRIFHTKCGTSTYDAAGEGLSGTTNIVEGWNYGLQAFFSVSLLNSSLPLRNLEKIQKCRSLNKFHKLTKLSAPIAPFTKFLKNRCKISKAVMSSKILCRTRE